MLDFGQSLAQTYFFDFWVVEGMLIPSRGVRSQSHDGKLQLLQFLDFRDFRPLDTVGSESLLGANAIKISFFDLVTSDL